VGEYHTDSFSDRRNHSVLLRPPKTVTTVLLPWADIFLHSGGLLYQRVYIYAAGTYSRTDYHIHRKEKNHARLNTKNICNK